MTRAPRFFALLVTLAAVTAAGCSSGSSEDSSYSNGSGSTASGPELDASAEKIVAANSSLDLVTARCIVSSMTANGSIGVAEVLEMNFQHLGDNAERLQGAYEDGVVACT